MICNINKGSGGSLKRTKVATAHNTVNVLSVDISQYSANWKNLTINNFAINNSFTTFVTAATSAFSDMRSVQITLSYDSSTGLLTCPQSIAGTPGGYAASIFDIYLYEIE